MKIPCFFFEKIPFFLFFGGLTQKSTSLVGEAYFGRRLNMKMNRRARLSRVPKEAAWEAGSLEGEGKGERVLRQMEHGGIG